MAVTAEIVWPIGGCNNEVPLYMYLLPEIFCTLNFWIPGGHPKIFQHRKFTDLRYRQVLKAEKNNSKKFVLQITSATCSNLVKMLPICCARAGGDGYGAAW